MQQNGLGAAFDDLVDVLLFQHGFAVHDHVIAFDRDHFARILVHEVLHPGREHAGRQLAAYGLPESRFGDLHLVREVENLENLLVGLIADRPQKRGDGELLFAVDVGVHHVVDVRGELDPRPLEGDDTRRIEFRTVGMHALSEEDTRRAVQLRHDDALRTVDDERTPFGHIGNRTEIDVLNDDTEIFVLRIGAIELQLGLQGHAVRQTALQALLDRVTGRIDVVVDKLENEIVSGIRNWEILLKHLVEALVLAILGRGVHLEKISE